MPKMQYAHGALRPEREQVHELARQMQVRDSDDPALLDLLQEVGVTHVYVGQKQGRVNYAGDHTIDPERLAASPNYELLYHQDRVWVFEINR